MLGDQAEGLVLPASASLSQLMVPPDLAVQSELRQNETDAGQRARASSLPTTMKGSPIMLIIPPFKDFVDEVRAEERTQAERMAL